MPSAWAPYENMNGRSIRINRGPVAVAVIIITIVLVYFLNFHQEERPAVYGMLRNQNQVNLRKLLIGAIQAAQRGGLEVLDVARTRDLKQRSKGQTDEGADDPFTDADGRSHCVMKNGLHRIFPRLAIYSEEDTVECSEARSSFDLDPTVLHENANIPDVMVNVGAVTVWVDPLDATKEFTEQLYEYVTTMVCIAVKGNPVIGVIHSPFSGQTAWAFVGHSMSEYLASINQEKRDASQPVIIVSRSHAGGVKNFTRNVFGEQAKIVTAAGAGYKVLQVVANNATAYLHTTKIKKWDICAGDAILRALGGQMTTLENMIIDYGQEEPPVNYDGVLATVVNHKEYMKKVNAYHEIVEPSAKRRGSRRWRR